MLLIPIGHDQPIRRFPWLTIAFITICTLVQLWRSVAAPSEQEIVGATVYVKRVEQRVLQRFRGAPDIAELADHLNGPVYSAAGDAQILADFRAAKLCPPNDEDFLALRAAEKTRDELGGRDPILRFAVHPDDGLSINMVLSAFIHDGWLLLVRNMLFLWLCGSNLEDRWGRTFFGCVYVSGAIVSAGAWEALHHGQNLKMVGAAGSIGVVMGAFVIALHGARLKLFWAWTLTRHGTFFVPAFVVGPLWLGGQLIDTVFADDGAGGTAFAARFGTFAFGALLAALVRFTGLEKKLAFQDDEAGTWREDPDYVRALELTRTEPAEALRLLRGVVERNVGHREARRELLNMAIVVRDRQVATSVATGVFGHLAELFAWEEIVSLYRDLDEAIPNAPLSDRALAIAVRAALCIDDPALALQAAARLIAAHPQSPLLRGSLWDLGPAQQREGLAVIAPETLERFAGAQ